VPLARNRNGFYLEQGALRPEYFRKYAQPNQGEMLVMHALKEYLESAEREKKMQEESVQHPAEQDSTMNSGE